MSLNQCSVNMYDDDTAFYNKSHIANDTHPLYVLLLFNLVYVMLVNGWMQTK